jgi:arginyl-tRNA synthetase
MTSLLSELSATGGAAFAAEGLPAELGQVQVSDRADLAQFQCNGALAAAKLARANPRGVAEKIAARLRDAGLFEEVSIAGPGFINLKLKDEVLQQRLQQLAADPKSALPGSGVGKRAILDFGGPNIAKPMHVGHLRSAIIGDCLQRLFRANGWEVTSDVHLGDWGLPMGQLIAELAIRRPDLPYFDPADRTPYPEQSPVSMDDLEQLYPEAAAACKADPGQLEAARQATLELQAGRPGYRALWRHLGSQRAGKFSSALMPCGSISTRCTWASPAKKSWTCSRSPKGRCARSRFTDGWWQNCSPMMGLWAWGMPHSRLKRRNR